MDAEDEERKEGTKGFDAADRDDLDAMEDGVPLPLPLPLLPFMVVIFGATTLESDEPAFPALASIPCMDMPCCIPYTLLGF